MADTDQMQRRCQNPLTITLMDLTQTPNVPIEDAAVTVTLTDPTGTVDAVVNNFALALTANGVYTAVVPATFDGQIGWNGYVNTYTIKRGGVLFDTIIRKVQIVDRTA